MDGSRTAQIFPSRKLSALAHTIHANIHTDINIIYPSRPNTYIIMVRLGLWKCLLKTESFELGSITGWGDSASWRPFFQFHCPNRFEIAFKDFQKKSSSMIRELRGKRTIEVTVGKSCDLVFAAEFHRQPMEFIQQWCLAFVPNSLS